MAVEAVLTRQWAFVGTDNAADLIEAVAKRGGVSKAYVVRFAVNSTFGLLGKGYLPDGVTMEDMVQAALETMGHPAPGDIEE
jgi:hypothetical protein